MLRSSALKNTAVGNIGSPPSRGTARATPSSPTNAIAEFDVPKSRPSVPARAPCIGSTRLRGIERLGQWYAPERDCVDAGQAVLGEEPSRFLHRLHADRAQEAVERAV